MANYTKTEKRTARLGLLIKPSIKEQAETNAQEDGRSVSNYIEWLIQQDSKRREK